MPRFSRTAIAALSLATLAGAPAFAGDALSPIGSWQVTTGEARYKVMPCGNGEICAKLVWLRDDARTAENLQYLNKYVVTHAVPASGNKWTATVNYEGESLGGSVTMLGKNKLRLTGCKLIACKAFEFTRI